MGGGPWRAAGSLRHDCVAMNWRGFQWLLVVLTSVLLLGLTVLFFHIGLDDANKLAGVIGGLARLSAPAPALTMAFGNHSRKTGGAQLGKAHHTEPARGARSVLPPSTLLGPG